MNRVVALIALIFVLPIMALIALAIRIFMGRPVLFVQQRSGLHGTPFEMLKFRTMRPPNNSLEPDAVRITKLGKLLRATSLDELPSLLNIVRGEMNLVGPRPLMVHYLKHYNETQRLRLEVKPGLTGLAQIEGRNTLTWEQKFDLDVWYVTHRNVWMDLKIILRTIPTLLKVSGISHPDHATMPFFRAPDSDEERY